MATSNGEIIKGKAVLVLSAMLASISFAASPVLAANTLNTCAKFNFSEIFYADFSTGSHWNNSAGDLVITWSAQSLAIGDEEITRAFTQKQLQWIRTAFESWDKALDTVSFQEVQPDLQPQITIGFVDLAPSQIQPNAVGFWSAWVTNASRERATIKLKSDQIKWFSNSKQFIHTVQHELGNVLGLGDITPTSKFASVLEDPWQPPYGNSRLGATDISLIRQLYGEATCPKQAKATSPEVRER